jgi:hypothetical protein
MIFAGARGFGLLLARARVRVLLVAVAGAAVFGALAGAAPASVAGSGAWNFQSSENPGTLGNELRGVAATSRTNAWAVGDYSDSTGLYRTLVERWDGMAWQVQTSADRGGSSNSNVLFGVAATSASDGWAVGYDSNPARTLVERWNGTAWTVKSSPNPGGSTNNNYLHAVAATSPTNAWAVGYYSTHSPRDGQPVIERWNGTAWKVQKSPTLHGVLFGVTALSASDAWAVGDYYNGTTEQTLIEHWNGTVWKVQTSPNPGGSISTAELGGVAATSPTNAWAVGYYANPMNDLTLIEHWNGEAWKVTPSPSPGTGPSLASVAATSSGNAWAVGTTDTRFQSLIEHWNGTAWQVQTSPGEGELDGVAATSASNAWAAGFSQSFGGTIIDHWG